MKAILATALASILATLTLLQALAADMPNRPRGVSDITRERISHGQTRPHLAAPHRRGSGEGTG